MNKTKTGETYHYREPDTGEECLVEVVKVKQNRDLVRVELKEDSDFASEGDTSWVEEEDLNEIS